MCRILCGTVTFTRPTTHPLLAGLPPLIVSRAGDSALGRWVEDTLRTLQSELAEPQPGTDAVLTRIADILVVQLLRSYLRAPESAAPSWLSAMRDPAIRRALGRIHAEPSEDWSLDALAGAASLSRSAFCERFARLVGEPPGAYLTRWRMHLAAELLRREGASVAEAAEQVGYRSESSFSNAFLRTYGQRPAAYRRAAPSALAMR
jgi:AraC-like DNA-binding protein